MLTGGITLCFANLSSISGGVWQRGFKLLYISLGHRRIALCLGCNRSRSHFGSTGFLIFLLQKLAIRCESDSPLIAFSSISLCISTLCVYSCRCAKISFCKKLLRIMHSTRKHVSTHSPLFAFSFPTVTCSFYLSNGFCLPSALHSKCNLHVVYYCSFKARCIEFC